jgi:hypothetical protein
LDFLGFSRPDLDLSMGYRVISIDDFFHGAFVVSKAPWKRQPHDWACGGDRSFMGQA